MFYFTILLESYVYLSAKAFLTQKLKSFKAFSVKITKPKG